MDNPTQYLQWGFIQISPANLIMIGLMIVVFWLAVVIRWPEKRTAPTLDTEASVSSKEEIVEEAKEEVKK